MTKLTIVLTGTAVFTGAAVLVLKQGEVESYLRRQNTLIKAAFLLCSIFTLLLGANAAPTSEELKLLSGSGTNDTLSGAGPQAPTLGRLCLEVRLEPAQHRISGTARIEVAEADRSPRLTFLLNGQLTVTSVRDGDRPARFSRGKPQQESKPLVVELAQSSGGGSARAITIEYHGTVPPPGAKDPDWMGALILRTNEIRMTEQTKWYPALPGQRASVEAVIILPSNLTLVWPGGISKLSDNGKEATWKVSGTSPMAPALIAGVYKSRTLAWGSREASIRVFPESEVVAEPILEESRRILSFMESQFGPYPFGQFSVCQMRVLNNRYSYNFACPGAVVLPTEIIQMARRPDRPGSSAAAEGRTDAICRV